MMNIIIVILNVIFGIMLLSGYIAIQHCNNEKKASIIIKKIGEYLFYICIGIITWGLLFNYWNSL
jgi:hypothetical protein